MTTLNEAAALARDERGLAGASTLGSSGRMQSLVGSAGGLPHLSTARPVLAFVSYGPVKLANIRVRPQVTVTFRNGWQWATVEGRAELAGPDDPRPWLDAEGLRLLRRAVFTAAGGDHEGWGEHHRAMGEQLRAAALHESDP